MNRLESISFRIKEKLIIIEKFVAGFSLLLLLILALTQVIMRNIFETGFSDIDVISRHLVLFVVFMGAALASENSSHIKIDCIHSLLNSPFKRKLNRPLLLISASVCTVFFYHSILFWLDELAYAPDNEQLALYLALIIPVGFFTLSFHFLLLSLTSNKSEVN